MDQDVKHTQTAGGIVLNQDGDVLVVNQHGNSWSLPKGHVDEGEEAIGAAIREIHEESGITELDLIRKLGTYQRAKIAKDGKGEDPSEMKHITMFLFETTERALQPIDPENPEARWVNPDDVPALLTHPKDKEFFTLFALGRY